MGDRSVAGALAVPGELAGVLPSGLRRGATVRVTGPTSLVLLLLAGAMADSDRWSAVVGLADLGMVAAAELGVPLQRLALVPHPGPELAAVVGALIDGMSLVAATSRSAGVSEATARALSGRARSRGCVLLVGQGWPAADLEIGTAARRWTGLSEGRGRLRYCEFDVEVRGRGSASRPRRATIRLPRAGVESAEGRAHGDGTNAQRPATVDGSPSASSPWQVGPGGLRGLPDGAQRAG
ncbi:hypothetical protein O7627_33555 [Solwaraspora sp. WMMD1047]|uniref:hypothetical protein n=1 Tax=Solwaraspora sp. WMMD1047 TaxID=3016102 RepID=UPI002417802A|nr:hypothetical protein [Solwaraspora sp. WMMD1047]MDG4834194.1 hypothetical protein [Solwaraspora sp. WMMD1047]